MLNLSSLHKLGFLTAFVLIFAVNSIPTFAMATLTVTTIADTVAVDGDCSLREAIQAANGNADVNECVGVGAYGTDTIEFAIGAVGSLQTIALTSRLPGINDPLILDATTQSGTAGCQNITTPLIELDGSGVATNSNGLLVVATGSGTTIRGLAINSFRRDGIEMLASDNNTIQCNFIGTDASGTVDAGNGRYGIAITVGSANNIVGTDGDGVNDVSEGNIISGNTNDGVRIEGGSNNNVLAGNLIGTDITGTSAIPNDRNGIMITSTAFDNRIGTDGNGVSDALERNIISGNLRIGIHINNGSNNVVAGNYVGADINGTTALGNGANGISVTGGSVDNIIGTNGDGNGDANEGNLISGNNRGMSISGATTSDNRIAGNIIGLDITGTVAMGNTQDGILISGGANNNIIGTNGDGNNDAIEGNIISNNGRIGVFVSGAATANNTIAGNFIGTDITGTVDFGNTREGIMVQQNSNNNIIGTNGDGVSDALEGNLISGNGRIGIRLGNAQNNRIAGNLIGTDVTGTIALGNTQDGIYVQNTSTGNIIGTDGDGVSDALERNIISGNTRDGIQFTGANVADNVIAGNYIGTDVTGTIAVPNASFGIILNNSTNNNRIGTNADGISDALERNIISGNNNNGVRVNNNANNNIFAGNYFGTDVTGQIAIPNNGVGIQLRCSANNNLVGTNGDGVRDSVEANLISGNSGAGMRLDCQAYDNTVAGNIIGLNANGNASLGNGGDGIIIRNADGGNMIGGDTWRERNIISGNGDAGISIEGGSLNPNTISHNYIGTTPGLANFANATNGIQLIVNNIASPTTIVDNNMIYYHSGAGIWLGGVSEFGIAGESINNCVVNNGAGVDNTTGIPVIFEDNYWGASDGPSGTGTGTGDSVSADVDFDPFAIIIPGRCGVLPVVVRPTQPFIARFDPAISKLGFLTRGQVGVQGEQIEWIITVSNISTVTGQNVIITDTIDSRLQIDRVDAPAADVNDVFINGQTVTVIYPTINAGETVQFSIFTTVIDGIIVSNTACVDADNQGDEECATAIPISQLPETGETPFWRNWLALFVSTLLLGIGYMLFPKLKRKKTL